MADRRIVLSVSRRTDIPAFYLDWFAHGIDMGVFDVANPYNGRIKHIPVNVETVHTIVFWSKNFGPFLENPLQNRLLKQGYHLYFNFTINSEDAVLEPNISPLANRLKQLSRMCDCFGADVVTWRFDPICFYYLSSSKVNHNLNDFERIAEFAANCGIKRCITSFFDDYAKITRRLKRLPQITMAQPELDVQIEILRRMEKILAGYKIILHLCCEKNLLKALPKNSAITAASCIPNDFLMARYGGKLSLRKDTGQRVKLGCGCHTAIDIGDYSQHPCFHNCLYCYANPSMDTNSMRHPSPNSIPKTCVSATSH